MSKQEFNILGRNIYEFKYDPIISFYDWKGTLAEYLIKEMGFDGFRVAQNRIDLVNPDEQNFLVFYLLLSFSEWLKNKFKKPES